MKNVLLIDFNNLAIRCFFTPDVGGYTPFPEYQIWKYQLFNSIWSYIWKFDVNIDEVVLAVDAHKSWRKVLFSRYKEKRASDRDKSEVDWDMLHNHLNSYVDELAEFIPFKTLKIQNCEADDIIGVLCLHIKESNYIVVSNDEDYNQLCDADRVRVYNPKAKKWVTCDDVESFVVSKCLMGQAKDGIFNVKTSLDWGLTEDTQKEDGTPKRKPGFGPKTLEKVMKDGYEKWLEKNNLQKRFDFNRNLIDFNKIPETIQKRIISSYVSYKYPDPSNIYEFFRRNGFRSFLEKYEQTETKLLTFY